MNKNLYNVGDTLTLSDGTVIEYDGSNLPQDAEVDMIAPATKQGEQQPELKEQQQPATPGQYGDPDPNTQPYNVETYGSKAKTGAYDQHETVLSDEDCKVISRSVPIRQY